MTKPEKPAKPRAKRKSMGSHPLDATTPPPTIHPIMVKGRVTGEPREGDQCPGMSHAICHACGLGYKCFDADCPNDTPNPMFQRPVFYTARDDDFCLEPHAEPPRMTNDDLRERELDENRRADPLGYWAAFRDEMI